MTWTDSRINLKFSQRFPQAVHCVVVVVFFFRVPPLKTLFKLKTPSVLSIHFWSRDSFMKRELLTQPKEEAEERQGKWEDGGQIINASKVFGEWSSKRRYREAAGRQRGASNRKSVKIQILILAGWVCRKINKNRVYVLNDKSLEKQRHLPDSSKQFERLQILQRRHSPGRPTTRAESPM